MRWLTALALAGCLPKRIVVDPPEWTETPSAVVSGPSVAVGYPIDARPAGERRDLARYQGNNFATLVYGDGAISPTPLEAIDRMAAAALRAEGIPAAPWEDADYRVRVFVLGHAGRRDMSDANWVSTATGGLAGTVGQFVYDNYAVVDARLRLEVRDRAGAVVAVRDVRAFHVEHGTVGRNWSLWYLYLRAPNAEMFDRAFDAVHAALAHDVVAVIEQARRGEPVVAGLPATATAYHFLEAWDPPESLDFLPGKRASDPDVVVAKFGSPTFSVLSGQEARKGETVGRVGAPQLGYDVGIGDRSQLLFDLTAFGEVNQAGAGIRWRALERGGAALALEERFGFDFTLFDLQIYPAEPSLEIRPVFAGATDTVAAVASLRTGDFTVYGRGGGAVVGRLAEVADARTLPDLRRGLAWGPQLGVGLEYQLGPTVAVAGQVVGNLWIQDGAPLPGDVGDVWIAPQITVGLR